jgi:hypothetical protein
MRRVIVCSFAFAGLATGVARADSYYDDYDAGAETPAYNSYAWHEPGMLSGIGVSAALGAGYGQFIDNQATSNLGTGQAAWSFRLAFGTHIPIGLEAAYVGTVSNLDPALDGGASLLGTDLETDLRWNILPHYKWNPFIFGGVGWQRYDITNLDVSLADVGIADSDHLAIFPVGAGLSYRNHRGLVFDMRGTFRAAASSNMIVDTTGDRANLDTWEASASLGYEM